MRDAADTTVVVRENQIRLIRRPESDKWQAHFKVEVLGKWVRKATKQSDLERAKTVAEDMWMRARVLSQEGHPVISKKFKAVAEILLRDLEIKIAADKTKRGSNNDYVGALKTYLIPFFGAKNIDRINQEVFTEFCEWRRQKVGRELSHSAQANHNAALSLVFDYAIERGYMTSLQRPVLKNLGEAGGRRPDFSAQEVEHLVAHLPTWVANGRKGITQMYRELLAVYIPFAAATGMRPGTEMEFLEWRHIEVHDIAGEPVLYAHIQKGKTVKKNKPSGAVLHRSCWLYLEALRQLAPEFQDKTLYEVLREKHEVRLFRMRNGVQPTHLTTQFKQLLEETGLLKCPTTGEDRTLYSLRHFAITQMVAKGLTAEQIQSQVRTSATMIAKFYNHMKPLMNAAEFAGLGEAREGDAVAQLLNNTPNDNLMHFAEISTGLTIALVMQNKTALEELRQELKTAAAQQSS
jgi:integrase